MNQQLFTNLPQIYYMPLNDSKYTRTSESAEQSLFENQSQSRAPRKLQSESNTDSELHQRQRKQKIF